AEIPVITGRRSTRQTNICRTDFEDSMIPSLRTHRRFSADSSTLIRLGVPKRTSLFAFASFRNTPRQIPSRRGPMTRRTLTQRSIESGCRDGSIFLPDMMSRLGNRVTRGVAAEFDSDQLVFSKRRAQL